MDGYQSSHFALLAAVDARHFWFRARNRAIAGVVDRVVAAFEPGYRVLEIGCGAGTVLAEVERRCPGARIVGLDLFAEGLAVARARVRCALVRGDMRAAPFARPFDLVGLFDVLEHLADDAAVLGSLRALVASGGALLLTVPAYQWLWSEFDVASCHRRRYAEDELRSKLRAAGFEVEFLTPFMMSALPLVYAARRLRRGGANGGSAAMDRAIARELRVRPVFNGLMRSSLAFEAPLLRRRRRLPFGTSLLAIARPA